MAKEKKKLKKNNLKKDVGSSKSKAIAKKETKQITTFFKDLKSELKKVVWPTKKETINATATALMTVVVVAIFVVLSDYLFHNLIKTLILQKG